MFLVTEERRILSFTNDFLLIQKGFGKILSMGHIFFLLDCKSISSECHVVTDIPSTM